MVDAQDGMECPECMDLLADYIDGSLPRHQAILDAIQRRQPNRAREAIRSLVLNTGRAIERLSVGR